MAKTDGGPEQQPEQQSGPQLSVLGQYIKDFSFENPNAPRSLQQTGQQPQQNGQQPQQNGAGNQPGNGQQPYVQGSGPQFGFGDQPPVRDAEEAEV